MASTRENARVWAPWCRPARWAAAVLWLGVMLPAAATAQSDDSVGVRAQGMAGAFTAVADDASATWWNPAGLGAWNSSGQAGGTFINAIFDLSRTHAPSSDQPASGPAWRVGEGGIALASPALGLSYYRLRISEIQPAASIAAPGAVRQDQGPAAMSLRSLAIQQLGATFGQSLGDHVVVGATVKLLRGTLGADSRPAAGASLDQAGDLAGSAETHAGVDFGVMATLGELRAAVALRNVTAPEFGSGSDVLTLQRHARAGLAWLSPGAHGALGAVTVSADADLTSQATVRGDERRVAGGIEVSNVSRRLTIRGGGGASTVGDGRVSVSAGLSVAVRGATFVDLAVRGGADEARRGWGVALRVTF